MVAGAAGTREDHLARLRRVEGQLRGIGRMIEDDRPCGDVLLQLRAAIQALCRLQDHVLRAHLRSCLRGGMDAAPESRDQTVEEIFELVSRYRGP